MPKQWATPGNRQLYREVLESRSLAACGILANALWPRLLLLVDDQGRMAGGTSEILTSAFPRQLATITYPELDTALAELEAQRMVIRYRAGGHEYLQLRDWWRWNRSMRRMLPSRHPRPAQWRDGVYGMVDTPKSFEAFVSDVGEPGPATTPRRPRHDPSRGQEAPSRRRKDPSRGRQTEAVHDGGKGLPAASPPRDHAGARAGEPSRAEKRGSTARARDPDARPPRRTRAAADSPSFDPDARPDLTAMARRGWRFSAAQADDLAELAANLETHPIDGLRQIAGWIDEASKRGDLHRLILDRGNALRAERATAADQREADWQATKAAAPTLSPDIAAMTPASAANGASRVSREAAIEQLRTVRGQVPEPAWTQMLERYHVSETELEEPVSFDPPEEAPIHE
jgi:hypothetical protein